MCKTKLFWPFTVFISRQQQTCSVKYWTQTLISEVPVKCGHVSLDKARLKLFVMETNISHVCKVRIQFCETWSRVDENKNSEQFLVYNLIIERYAKETSVFLMESGKWGNCWNDQKQSVIKDKVTKAVEGWWGQHWQVQLLYKSDCLQFRWIFNFSFCFQTWLCGFTSVFTV